MSYQETIEYLFSATPCFQQIGAKAYKPGLERVIAMAEVMGNPHKKFRTIHVGGTNGKGSTSSTLAAVLIASGYKTGLFTSPHLVDFRERIRIDGIPVSEQFVVDFVARMRPLLEQYAPSFFELTTLMAFCHFAEQKVDVAVVEVGMGGRLDSTNIIEPELSIITNISPDHTQFLGNSLSAIAVEKAGIIKRSRPVVIGETTEETRSIFSQKAEELSAPIYFAEEEKALLDSEDRADGIYLYSRDYGSFFAQLGGAAQHLNARTILTALSVLEKSKAFAFPKEAVWEGFASVIEKTGLLGRWQKLSSSPRIFCDTGHNEAGIVSVVRQIALEEYDTLHILFGMVADKDWRKVLSLLPREAKYHFVTPPSERGLPAQELLEYAVDLGLSGTAHTTMEAGFETVLREAKPNDMVYVGGSNYVVAEILKTYYPQLVNINNSSFKTIE